MAAKESTPPPPPANELDSPRCKAVVVVLGVGLRLLSYFYLCDFFESSPQVVTPWNSFKRFREGVFLYEAEVGDFHEGDMFHVMPMFIFALKPLMHSQLYLRGLWVLLDLTTAYCAQAFVSEYIGHSLKDSTGGRAERMANLAFAVSFLNPMAIGVWTVLSLSSIVNALVACALLLATKGRLLVAAVLLAVAVHLNVYYLILAAFFLLLFSDRRRVECICSLLLPLAAFCALNASLVKEPLHLWENTLGFFLRVPDLTPNVGIFWYFFIQIFEHYRLLFLFAFQLNAVVYVAPLTATLRHNAPLLAVALLMVVAIFSSYTSYAETALYLPLLCSFVELHKYVRYSLVLVCALVTSVVLTPVMWQLWVVSGSGNANFYFASVMVFQMAQIFLFADVIGAYLRMNALKGLSANEEEESVERMKLISISPY